MVGAVDVRWFCVVAFGERRWRDDFVSRVPFGCHSHYLHIFPYSLSLSLERKRTEPFDRERQASVSTYWNMSTASPHEASNLLVPGWYLPGSILMRWTLLEIPSHNVKTLESTPNLEANIAPLPL